MSDPENLLRGLACALETRSEHAAVVQRITFNRKDMLPLANELRKLLKVRATLSRIKELVGSTEIAVGERVGVSHE